ncbi:MAG TPA: methyltransferase domain-containing protein [Candidatus Binataceae bacterium]
MKKIWPVHYALGMAGIAVIRNWMAGDETAKACADELVRLTRGFTDDPALGFVLDIPDMEVRSGYGAWAETYDNLPNPLITIEEPVIQRLLDAIPPGRALDAACGTGRYTRYLGSRGHQVTGVDVTADMIQRARARALGAKFLAGSLDALPFAAGSFDLVMCGLALTHLPQVSGAIAEFARVLRPGGRAIIADHHPMAGFLGGSAIFRDKNGYFRNVKSFVHPHAEYISAFVAAGLEIRGCFEPVLTEALAASGLLFAIAPQAFLKGSVGLPIALIWLLSRR